MRVDIGWLRRVSRRAFFAGALAFAAVAAAGSQSVEPDAKAMIDALRLASPAGPVRHRNLVVVARAGSPEPTTTQGADPALAPEPAAGLSTPSLSLALVFAPNSAQLRPESGQVLGQLVAAMLSHELRGQRFLIEGHSDARGSSAANQRLSLERAEEVRQYLVTLGVPAGRLRAAGRGAQDLANPADPGSAENRRVRVVALP